MQGLSLLDQPECFRNVADDLRGRARRVVSRGSVREKSAEAIVAKMTYESRSERRAEGPRNRLANGRHGTPKVDRKSEASEKKRTQHRAKSGVDSPKEAPVWSVQTGRGRKDVNESAE